MGCATIQVPEISGRVPCQVQLSGQVEEAIYSALDAQHWVILAADDHWIKARKQVNQRQATVEIAYGYRGFSIDYRDSEQMQYDAESDTIDATYAAWVKRLERHIETLLQHVAADTPPSKKCTYKNYAIL